MLRYQTTEAFLASGTPLERLPYFRELIERGVGSLADKSHLAATYIPMIESEQISFLTEEFKDVPFSIQFDGTTRLGEAIVCAGRYCSSDFELRTRLLLCQTTAKHVNGRQLASLITRLLCTTFKFDAI